MKISFKNINITQEASDCLMIGLFEGETLRLSGQQLDQASQGHLKAIIKQGDFTGQLEETLMLPAFPGIKAKRLVCVGLGQEAAFNIHAWRKAMSAGLKNLKSRAITKLIVCFPYAALTPIDQLSALQYFAAQALMMSYEVPHLKSKAPESVFAIENIFLVQESTENSQHKHAIAIGLATGGAANYARDLANLPANICTPAYLVESAKKLAKTHKAFHVDVLDIKKLEKEKMGAFLAVAQGSTQAPYGIVLSYSGGSKQDAPIVLVGKGITFDSGGISIKPAANMDEMKYDMCGAATVLGVLKACAELNLPLNVTGVIAACENMPSGHAVKPGDVVTSRSGQTIEILNTDAEGRLILCDMLDYCKTLKPKLVIDIATLTGAIIIALGPYASGLFSPDDELAAQLTRAGEATGDRVWRMPVWEDYKKMLDSRFADIANVSMDRAAGSSAAAAFLACFTKDYRWAHLDIAATAWLSGKEKGATGRPIPMLVEFLCRQASE